MLTIYSRDDKLYMQINHDHQLHFSNKKVLHFSFECKALLIEILEVIQLIINKPKLNNDLKLDVPFEDCYYGYINYGYIQLFTFNIGEE